MHAGLWRARDSAASPKGALELLSCGAQAEKRHFPDRLEEDRAAHLRHAFLAVGEADRHLGDAEAGTQRAVGQLDLEGVALGGDGAEVEALEHLPAEALEAAGEVADADT